MNLRSIAVIVVSCILAVLALTMLSLVFPIKPLIGEPQVKNHGRVAYTLSCGFGSCVIDLSFMPSDPVAVVHKRPHKQRTS